MIEKHVQLPGGDNNAPQNDEDSDSDNESDEDVMSELIFEPEDKSSLLDMYEAIKKCQELHPDPEDMSTDEDEAFDDMYEDVHEENGAGDHQENVENMGNLSIAEERAQNGFGAGDHKQDMDEDQFEDAD